jgi:hypothetical protein
MPQIVRRTVVTEFVDPSELLDLEDEDQEDLEDGDEEEVEEKPRPRRRVRLLAK